MNVSVSEYPYKREVVGERESKENFSTFFFLPFPLFGYKDGFTLKITEFSMEELP